MLISCTSWMGYLASHKLLMRKIFMEQYLQFIGFVQVQIGYAAISPYKIAKKYPARSEIGIFLEDLKQELACRENFPKAWSNSIKKTKREFGLTESDVDMILDFGEKLGTSDIRSQLKHCEVHTKLASEHLKEAERMKKEMSRLYLTLGITIGTGLSLLFI